MRGVGLENVDPCRPPEEEIQTAESRKASIEEKNSIDDERENQIDLYLYMCRLIPYQVDW